MATQDKKTALNAISQAIDEDIENIIEGKEIVIPETEDTCFWCQEQVYTNLMSRINSKRQKVLLDENCCCFIAILNIEYSILGIF